MHAKAKEAQPILRRNQHFFKISTLYVVDKLNFKMLRQQQLKDQQAKNAGANLKPLLGVTASHECKLLQGSDKHSSQASDDLFGLQAQLEQERLSLHSPARLLPREESKLEEGARQGQVIGYV